VVIAKTGDMNYSNALNAAWLGGKKNDVIVVIGAPEYPKIAWVDVLSWTDQQLFKVQLRDAIRDIGEVDRVKIVPVIHDRILNAFKRKHMAEFEYLKDRIEPSPAWLWMIGIISAMLSIGLSIFFSRAGFDLFGPAKYGQFRRRF
jgi:hypothetical protein